MPGAGEWEEGGTVVGHTDELSGKRSGVSDEMARDRENERLRQGLHSFSGPAGFDRGQS